MKTTIRWQAWRGDLETQLTFPGGWAVTVAEMDGAPAAGADALHKSLRSPIGAPPLCELARGRTCAAIVVEDITRPLHTEPILTEILQELQSAGLQPQNIWLVIGLGAHVPVRRADLLLKLGKTILDDYSVYQSSPYDHLEHLGRTRQGTPIWISRFLTKADLRISVGSLLPHPYAGFGGGPKTVAVGVAGIETLAANHGRACQTRPLTGHVGPENEFHQDLIEIAQAARLDWIINGVVNARRETAGLFAGDPVAAHQAAAAFASRVYSTRIPPPSDVAVFNAYPKDTDLVQSINALNVTGGALANVLKPDGTPVMVTGSPDGAGLNFLESYGMRGYLHFTREMMGLGCNGAIIYSPNVSYPDTQHTYPPDTLVFDNWELLTRELVRRHGDRASATVFPTAAIQIPAPA